MTKRALWIVSLLALFSVSANAQTPIPLGFLPEIQPLVLDFSDSS